MPETTQNVMATSSARLTSQMSLSGPRGLTSFLVVRMTQSQCSVRCASRAAPSPMPSHSWTHTRGGLAPTRCALTIGEIRLGIERLRRKDAAQADLLEQWLRGLHAGYGDHIIDVDAAAAEEWGRLSVPDPLPVIDGLLAASAKIRGWTLVTRNTADVARSGVALLNPFEPAAP
jgi:toxin FitB